MAARVTSEFIEVGIVKSTPGAIRVTSEFVEAGIVKSTPGAIRVTVIFIEVGISNYLTSIFSDSLNNWNDAVVTDLLISGDPDIFEDLNNWNDTFSYSLISHLSLSDTLTFYDFLDFWFGVIGQSFLSIFDNTANIKGKGKDTSALKDHVVDVLAIFLDGQDMLLQITDVLDMDDDTATSYPWGDDDTLSLSDELQVLMATPLDLSDTLELTDSVFTNFPTSTLPISVADTVFLYDFLEIGGTSRSLEDFMGFADTLRMILGYWVQNGDTLALSDLSIRSLGSWGALEDNLNFFDDLAVTSFDNLTIDQSDTLGDLSESFETLIPVNESNYIRRYLNDVWT